MTGKVYASLLAFICLASGFITSCSSSSKPTPVISITATSGAQQKCAIGTAFVQACAAPLVVTVTSNGAPASGVMVTFAAPSMGASGTFASNNSTTETDTTGPDGVAASSSFTANTTTGGYTVSASATGATSSVSFALTNVTANTYAFYVTGSETINPANGGDNFYCLAGAVTIDGNGDVLGGEQDYNDGNGITSQQPAGDTILPATAALSISTPAIGQGTLTLTTSNPAVGVDGVETFGILFVNDNHALISQFDASATSSGSLDLQTAGTPSRGFAFTVSGVDAGYDPIAFGGVFTYGGSGANGVVDSNDAGAVTPQEPLTITINAGDSYGRGTITSSLVYGTAAILLNYYMVGPEAIRIIDVDATDSAVGSAFGQGTNAGASSNASLGSSVFSMASNPWASRVGAVGQFTTNAMVATFQGVADDNEPANGISALDFFISGTYSVASSGYGSLTFTSELGTVSGLQIYLTDPGLNLNDPNNPTGGGGALALDLNDGALAGATGVVTPQTDTATSDFNGPYAVGGQDFNSIGFCTLCEVDILGQGTMTSGGGFSATVMISDPFETLSTNATDPAVTFSGTPPPDFANPGRYSSFPLDFTVGTASQIFNMVIYQASAGQLFWLDLDENSLLVGPIEQQESLAAPAVRKFAAKR